MSTKLKTQQDPMGIPLFNVGDKVRFATRFTPENQYLRTLNERVVENYAADRTTADAIHTVTASDSAKGFITTDLLGGPWQNERFELVKDVQPNSNPFAWLGGPPELLDEVTCISPPLFPVDRDLQRTGYHEECSEYRPCQNENGDWVIEASRRKIIAQASDEAEAQRIADALNLTCN